jgi:two-component system, OmpR family, KDP operon response regulator KdpE
MTTGEGPHILLVEDDEATRSAVVGNLRSHGYRVAEAGSLAEAARSLDAGRPDLILLDLGLPDGDGSTLIRRVRRDTTTPILVLSARGQEHDQVGALDAGADDYVTKPFGLGELLARVRAAQRRAGLERSEPVLRFDDVTVDLARRRVTAAGEAVHLTPTEYKLLESMVTNPGKLLTQRWLLQRVWGGAYGDEANYLRVYVRQLRQKLGDRADAPRFILTEPGVGYRWIPDPSSET